MTLASVSLHQKYQQPELREINNLWSKEMSNDQRLSHSGRITSRSPTEAGYIGSDCQRKLLLFYEIHVANKQYTDVSVHCKV